MSILIKRYSNRKLYDTNSSRYITLKGIAALLDAGEEVHVIDNETGEDITEVALSQILVDTKRSKSRPPSSLLNLIMERGGDALYDAIKRSVDDAGGGLGELQDRFRRIIGESEGDALDFSRSNTDARGEDPSSQAGSGGDRGRFSNWIAYSAPDFDAVIQNAIERVFKLLDLPRRKDLDVLNQNLERVVQAVEALESALAKETSDAAARASTPAANDELDPDTA